MSISEALLLKRFNTKIKVTPTECWEWQGSATEQGYGYFRMLGQNLAHRVSFILHNNRFPLPKGMCVLHKCDNPPCVNPDHLFAGTRDTNNKDRVAKGRNGDSYNGLKTHCENGHEFTEENTYIRPAGTRFCRECGRASTLKRYREDVKNGGRKRNHQTTHCRHGHEYTPANTHITKDGSRLCKECNRQRGRLNYRKKKGCI